MYRPIEMELKGSGTKFRDVYKASPSQFTPLLQQMVEEMDYWSERNEFPRIFLDWYADWYTNPVGTIVYSAEENPVLCLSQNLTDAYIRNRERLASIHRAYESVTEGENSTEEYVFGKQKQKSDRGARTDTSTFGERGDSVDEYSYPMAGYSQEVKPGASTKSRQDSSTDTTTYGGSTDTLEQDAHTNTVKRKDSTVSALKSLSGLPPFTRAVLDVFRDCFTLSEFGVW